MRKIEIFSILKLQNQRILIAIRNFKFLKSEDI